MGLQSNPVELHACQILKEYHKDILDYNHHLEAYSDDPTIGDRPTILRFAIRQGRLKVVALLFQLGIVTDVTPEMLEIAEMKGKWLVFFIPCTNPSVCGGYSL